MMLLREVEAFLTMRGMAPTRLGKLAVNDATFVRKLRAGRVVSPKNADRVRAFLRANGAALGGGDPAPVIAAATVSVASAKPGKFRVSAAVIRAAKLDGRDLPTFVTALIDMGLDCWRDDRAAHEESLT